MPEINRTYTGEAEDRCAVIEVDENALGLNNFNSLKNFVSEELKQGVSSFTFDLSNLKSINSSGLGILIGCLKTIKDAKGSLKIVNASEKILNIFKLTKLNNVFEFEGSS